MVVRQILSFFYHDSLAMLKKMGMYQVHHVLRVATGIVLYSWKDERVHNTFFPVFVDRKLFVLHVII